jgi:glycosyltransferase involved in cell wall biosynthesis
LSALKTKEVKMPLISIIVPIYNVEAFLPKCLDSILAQSFSDFEAILVDDGSTDRSGNICDMYAKKDCRLVVLHKRNGGQSSARNAALDIAKGEYIGFVDSDDYISSDMYHFLYKTIIEYDADLSICSFLKVSADGKPEQKKVSAIKKLMYKEEAIRNLLGRRYIDNYIWDKLYKKKLFNDIRFPENQLFEDIAIMYRIFDKCGKVIFINEPKYFYVQRQGSSVNCSFNAKKLKFVEECKKILDFSESKGGIYDEEAYACYVLSNLWCLYEAAREGMRYEQYLDTLLRNIRNNYNKVINSQYIKRADKIALRLLRYKVSPYSVSQLHSLGKKLNTKFEFLKAGTREVL